MTIRTKLSQWAMAVILFAGAVAAQAQTNATSTNTVAKIAPPPPPPKWQSSIALGVTIARGNTDTTLASVTAATEKKWGPNDLAFGADGLYGESKPPGSSAEQETAETLHGFSQYNRSVVDGLYYYFRLDGFHDGIADIKYRLTAAPGLGYYFVTNHTISLKAEIGPGYIYEKLDDSRPESFATLRIAERFDYIISPHAKAWESVEFLPQVDNFNNFIVNAEMGIDAGLTKKNNLSIRSVLDDSYVNHPAVDREKNDLKLITSLVYKF